MDKNLQKINGKGKVQDNDWSYDQDEYERRMDEDYPHMEKEVCTSEYVENVMECKP